MLSTLPPSRDHNTDPAEIRMSKLDAVGLTGAYRKELGDLTHYLNTGSPKKGDVIQFRSLLGSTLNQ